MLIPLSNIDDGGIPLALFLLVVVLELVIGDIC